MTEIHFCGGSSVRGLNDERARGGFAGRIQSYYKTHENYGVSVQIHAKAGRTLLEVVELLPADLGESNGQRKIVVCMVGASDQRLSQADAPPMVTLPEFRQGLHDLGDLCVGHAAELVLVGFHPINDRDTQPFVGTGEYFSDRRTRIYTEEVRAYAAREDLPYIPTWEALGGGTEGFTQYVSEDLLHLNSLGHIVMFNTVLPALDAIVMQSEVQVV